MVRVQFFILSVALTVIIQLTGLAIGKRTHNECANFGESCNLYNSQPCCEKNLLCKQGKIRNSSIELQMCVCHDGFGRINNQCQQIAGNLCLFDSDCEFQNHTRCSENNECVCQKNYIKIGLLCRPLIGSFCMKDEDCFPENSVCVNHECNCKTDFVPLSYERCVPTYFIMTCHPKDEVCQETKFFSCLNDGKCPCPPNYIALDNKCVPLLQEHCDENKHCLIDFSICVNNKCQCQPEYTAQDNNICLPTHLNYKCKFDEDCHKIQNSKCSEFEDCICKKNYYPLTKKICSPNIDGPCASNENCTVENSICIHDSCQCMFNFKFISNKCLPVLNQSCISDEDCVNIKFTKCSSNKKCICEEYYLASKDETSCLPLIGGQCELDEDCVTKNSKCYDRKCQCSRYYVPIIVDKKYECKQTVALGIPCKYNSNCALIKNSICSDDQVCTCRKKYYEFDNRTFCAPIIDGNCATDEDCKFDHFRCFNFTCQCKPNYSAVSGTQCEIEQFVVRCNKNIDCGDPWHTECSESNYCVCKSNNRLVNKATCYPLLNGLCWKDDQCLILNSVCIDFHCQCQSSFKAVATNLCIPD